MECPHCRSENAAANRFCSACGHALTPPAKASAAAEPRAAPAGERRHATILFCDMSGYTALSERLDPEEVNEILLRIRETAARVIARHGGIVNQFIGDEVMAVFGIPHASEEDPVLAIRAALDLHEVIRRETEGSGERVGERLAMHTGISTGLVMAQYRNDREGLYQLTGDTVNTAARMRALAEADEVLIGPSTQRLVRPYFELEPRAAVSVKGKALPLVPYRVLVESRIGSRFEAARERGFKGYVGRQREMDTLRLCLARALEGEGQVVTIEGEPGIGKSRLVYEFLKTIDREEITVPQSRCQPHGAEIPYFPFLDSLRRSLHLSDFDSHAEALEKAVANIKWIDPSLERFLPHFLQLLSIPSDYALPADLKGEALRRAIEEALAAIVTLTTRTQPMVHVIEDWHWSDPASRSAMARLLRLVPSYRLMVLVTYRSGQGFEFAQHGDRTAIRLNALKPGEAESLVCGLTGAEEAPAGLAALLCQSADGNPLFIEEACYSLLESGAVSVVDRHLVLRESLQQLLVPDTVQAVIRARLDRLDQGTRELIGRAAVIGRVFNIRILALICQGRGDLDEALDTLLAQEIIRQTRSLPEPEYIFRHVLTREVAYEALLHQQRKLLHEAVGTAIETSYPERLDENASVLAQHFARSARADKAVEYLLIAGHRAADLFANAEAAAYYDDALDLVKSIPPSPQAQRWQIDALLGQVAAGVAPRDLERDCRSLEQACRDAEALDDRRRRAQAFYWLGRIHYVRADLERAIECARQSQEIADELGDAALAAPPVNLMGRAYWQLSDFARSGQMMERSVEQMRSLGDKSEESTAAGFVSALFGYMGEFAKALVYSDRSLDVARGLKNPYAEAAAFHYRGIVRDQQGRWDEAIADYASAIEIASKAGDQFRVYIATFMQGRAHQMSGDCARGRELVEQALALAGRIGTTFLLGQAKSVLAACCLAAGEDEQARALCREAVALAEKAGDKFTHAMVLRASAEAHRAGGPEDGELALASLRRAVALQQEIGARPELARTYASLAATLESRGQGQDAARWRAEAKGLFDELDMKRDRDALA